MNALMYHVPLQERPFVCPYCEKTFKSNSNCRKHLQTHRIELTMAAVRAAGNNLQGDQQQATNIVSQTRQNLHAVQLANKLNTADSYDIIHSSTQQLNDNLAVNCYKDIAQTGSATFAGERLISDHPLERHHHHQQDSSITTTAMAASRSDDGDLALFVTDGDGGSSAVLSINLNGANDLGSRRSDSQQPTQSLMQNINDEELDNFNSNTIFVNADDEPDTNAISSSTHQSINTQGHPVYFSLPGSTNNGNNSASGGYSRLPLPSVAAGSREIIWSRQPDTQSNNSYITSSTTFSNKTISNNYIYVNSGAHSTANTCNSTTNSSNSKPLYTSTTVAGNYNAAHPVKVTKSGFNIDSPQERVVLGRATGRTMCVRRVLQNITKDPVHTRRRSKDFSEHTRVSRGSSRHTKENDEALPADEDDDCSLPTITIDEAGSVVVVTKSTQDDELRLATCHNKVSRRKDDLIFCQFFFNHNFSTHC